MTRPLDHVAIKGFKSIRNLTRFELGSLTIMVGANGAGKSNFVDFFRMLRAMTEERLRRFINQNGGADGFFHGGPKRTRQIEAELCFAQNKYRFVLEPTSAGEMMVANERVLFTGNRKWKDMGGGGLESGLKSWRGKRSLHGRWTGVEDFVFQAVSGWIVYHFHDTSLLADMRRDRSLHDWRELRPDASNLAAFLLNLKEKHFSRYQRIIETLQLIAPFIEDFILEPEEKGRERVVRLEWLQKGDSYPYQPWHLSDGTIRFLCLATALLQPEPPATIVIDEPELGLHPFALEVLAGLIREAAEKVQLIISTQSASLLNFFEPEEIVVVEREKGASQFRRLDRQKLDVWLEEYTLGDLWRKNVIDGGPSHELGAHARGRAYGAGAGAAGYRALSGKFISTPA